MFIRGGAELEALNMNCVYLGLAKEKYTNRSFRWT